MLALAFVLAATSPFSAAASVPWWSPRRTRQADRPRAHPPVRQAAAPAVRRGGETRPKWEMEALEARPAHLLDGAGHSSGGGYRDARPGLEPAAAIDYFVHNSAKTEHD